VKSNPSYKRKCVATKKAKMRSGQEMAVIKEKFNNKNSGEFGTSETRRRQYKSNWPPPWISHFFTMTFLVAVHFHTTLVLWIR